MLNAQQQIYLWFIIDLGPKELYEKWCYLYYFLSLLHCVETNTSIQDKNLGSQRSETEISRNYRSCLLQPA